MLIRLSEKNGNMTVLDTDDLSIETAPTNVIKKSGLPVESYNKDKNYKCIVKDNYFLLYYCRKSLDEYFVSADLFRRDDSGKVSMMNSVSEYTKGTPIVTFSKLSSNLLLRISYNTSKELSREIYMSFGGTVLEDVKSKYFDTGFKE